MVNFKTNFVGIVLSLALFFASIPLMKVNKNILNNPNVKIAKEKRKNGPFTNSYNSFILFLLQKFGQDNYTIYQKIQLFSYILSFNFERKNNKLDLLNKYI